MTGSYAVWAWALHSVMPQCTHLLLALPSTPIPLRKVLLSYVRIQPPLLEGSRFFTRFADKLDAVITVTSFVDEYGLPRAPYQLTLRELLEYMAPYTQMPVIMGFFAGCIISAPHQDYGSAEEELQKNIDKELYAGQNGYPCVPLDYTSIFAKFPRLRASRSLADNIPLNSLVNHAIYQCFVASDRQLSGRTIYPRLGRKTIGKRAQALAEIQLRLEEDAAISNPSTITDVEAVYESTGVKVQGPIEVRWSWKYNELKPRVYYAQGPTAYHAAKYIQPILNVILDCFEPVHRRDRFALPTDTFLSPYSQMRIYDYSSFTSNLTEVTNFLEAMAGMYEDTIVQIVDTRLGPQFTSVADVIREYNDVVNRTSDCDISHIRPLVSELDAIFRHCCGPLGVPGNISSCTLLHGIHMSAILQSLHRGRCVGDDALTLPEIYDEGCSLQFIESVGNIGDVGDDKTEIWRAEDRNFPDESGWQYVKRPITISGSTIEMGTLFKLPDLANLLGLTDDLHTSSLGSKSQRTILFVKQWCRLLDQLYPSQLTEIESDFLFIYQREAFRYFHLGAKRLHFTDLKYHMWGPPRFTADEFGRKSWRGRWLELFREEGRLESYEVPMAIGAHEDCWRGDVGETFMGFSHPALTLFVSLGFIESEMVMEQVTLDPNDGDEIFEMYLNLSYDFSYRYTIIRELPPYVRGLVTRSPYE